MDVLVTYDLPANDASGDRRRSKIAAICERYGVRVQYSVFECRLDETAIQRLISEIKDEIDPTRDCIHIYRIGRPFAAARESLGRRGHDWEETWIV